ncbi:MAG: ClbS/DfsB family four-helix bundle protein [Parachlamydiaceae bacterium]|nr:ClbS/DfsB family four-helix bundle protein [Parachlamydiaceae bacterium]
MDSILIQDIIREKNKLELLVCNLSLQARSLKNIDNNGRKVSASDLIAYQIGWGKCLIRWYEAGINNEIIEMPGDGFLKWDYVGLAQHFYKTYCYDSFDQQMNIFQQTVLRIFEIIQIEHQTGNLDRIGVWSWCTLPSGKQWPLSKWIKVNTAAPYKRAVNLIKKASCAYTIL